MPQLKQAPLSPSPRSLPTRMRFSAGLEIDRIGRTCYAVHSSMPAAGPERPTVSVTASEMPMARVVPCFPWLHKTIGEAFLDNLAKRLSHMGIKRPAAPDH